MNYKEMMINQAKSQGRISLHPYTIGVIRSIIKWDYNPDEKVNDISLALEGMYEAWNDKSLPHDYTDVKKPLLQTEAGEEITHPKCTINVAKVESLLDPWYLEQIAEERRVRREV